MVSPAVFGYADALEAERGLAGLADVGESRSGFAEQHADGLQDHSTLVVRIKVGLELARVMKIEGGIAAPSMVGHVDELKAEIGLAALARVPIGVAEHCHNEAGAAVFAGTGIGSPELGPVEMMLGELRLGELQPSYLGFAPVVEAGAEFAQLAGCSTQPAQLVRVPDGSAFELVPATVLLEVQAVGTDVLERLKTGGGLAEVSVRTGLRQPTKLVTVSADEVKAWIELPDPGPPFPREG
jgi:hypothetical protein